VIPTGTNGARNTCINVTAGTPNINRSNQILPNTVISINASTNRFWETTL